MELYKYKAKIVKVVDGDTADADVDLGFEVHRHVRVRLYGIDCWEMTGVERTKGVMAKARAEALIGGKEVFLESVDYDKYGRSVARIYLPDGKELTPILIQEGHGVPYLPITEQV